MLTGAVTSALSPVSYLTHPRYAEVAAILPGVTEVIRWGQDPITGPFTRVIDLHGSPRSRMVALRQHCPTHTLSRHSLRRRLRVWMKWGQPPMRVIDRYAETAQVTVQHKPWISVQGPQNTLILCPGAQWATKQWPLGKWLELGHRWIGEILVLGGPEEQKSLQALGAALGSRAEVIAERGFQRTIAALGRGALAVGGDTGLMHLCAAAGIPVIGLFGPTKSEDGFWCHEGEVIERNLYCRPCSRHGSSICPMGDHQCMNEIEVDQVWAAVERYQ